LIDLDKFFYGAVIGSLYIFGKKAGWQLAQLAMISQAFTAHAFPAAWLVGAVALSFVFFSGAFSHIRLP
jgi:uncharacterized membrane protein AbrB (regulator of aidB expression)